MPDQESEELGAMGPLKTRAPSIPTWTVIGRVASISRFNAAVPSTVRVVAPFAVGADVGLPAADSNGGAVAAIIGTPVGVAPGIVVGVAVRTMRVGVIVLGADAIESAAGTTRV